MSGKHVAKDQPQSFIFSSETETNYKPISTSNSKSNSTNNDSHTYSKWSGPMAVLIAFITLGVVYGVWFAYSVFLVALVDDMGWSRSLTAGAISVMSVVHGLSGPMNGRLVEKYGAQRVIACGRSSKA